MICPHVGSALSNPIFLFITARSVNNRCVTSSILSAVCYDALHTASRSNGSNTSSMSIYRITLRGNIQPAATTDAAAHASDSIHVVGDQTCVASVVHSHGIFKTSSPSVLYTCRESTARQIFLYHEGRPIVFFSLLSATTQLYLVSRSNGSNIISMS